MHHPVLRLRCANRALLPFADRRRSCKARGKHSPSIFHQHFTRFRHPCRIRAYARPETTLAQKRFSGALRPPPAACRQTADEDPGDDPKTRAGRSGSAGVSPVFGFQRPIGSKSGKNRFVDRGPVFHQSRKPAKRGRDLDNLRRSAEMEAGQKRFPEWMACPARAPSGGVSVISTTFPFRTVSRLRARARPPRKVRCQRLQQLRVPTGGTKTKSKRQNPVLPRKSMRPTAPCRSARAACNQRG